MALPLTSGGTTNVATSYSTSDPITPGGNRLVLAFVVNQSFDPGQVVAVPTLVGNGLNWDQVETITLAAVPERRLTCFRAMGANPTAGALNFSFGGQ
jgi:hypothetical protein